MSSNKSRKSKKLWASRFIEETDHFVENFTSSVDFDKRLHPYDIDGSIAHARMLCKVGILTTEEETSILQGLESIRIDINNGNFEWSVAQEDVLSLIHI